MEQRKVLVTGGGGFLGSAVIKKLIERGDTIRSFSRNFYPELYKLGIEQHQGDIVDFASVEKACQGMDVVFHTAAKAGVWGDYSEYYDANVKGTENVIAACLHNNVKALIHTSTPSVILNGSDLEGVDESYPYPEHYHSAYSKTKALAEKAVVAAAGEGLNAVILRPHIIWGPGDTHLVPRILKRGKRIVRIGNGENLVDTIYIDNAADAHVLAADRIEQDTSLKGNKYFICQNEPVRLWDLIGYILEWSGHNKIKRKISHKTAELFSRVLEFIHKTLRIDGEPYLTRYIVNELATSHWFDVSAAEKDLGFVPEISVEEGLGIFKEWMKTEYVA